MSLQEKVKRVHPNIVSFKNNIFFTVVNDSYLMQLAHSVDSLLKDEGIGELKVRKSEADIVQRIISNPNGLWRYTLKDKAQNPFIPIDISDDAREEENAIPFAMYLEKLSKLPKLPRITSPSQRH